MARVFAVNFRNVSIAAVQDLFSVTATAAVGFKVHSLTLGATSGTATGSYGLTLRRYTAQTTAGSGGAVVTPIPLAGPSAAVVTARANDTTGFVGTGGTVLNADACSFTNGYQYYPAPDDRPLLRTGETFVATLDGAPGTAQTVNGTLVIEEVLVD